MTMMFRVFCLLLAILLARTSWAADIQRVTACSGVVLRLRGDIKDGDYSRLRAHFARKEAIVGLDLSSDGGDLEEGLRIANLVRRKKLTVYVGGECDSACAFVFFSAAKRYFGRQSKIGVHSVSSRRDIEDRGSMLLTVKLARISAKLGVPDSAIGKMVTTRPTMIAYLDGADLSALHASAGNPFGSEPEKASEVGQPQQTCSSRPEAIPEN
ncbi:hypothetical protein [Bradyrhizobium sp.]|uniref:hypothetical protein n=2 Tax=Bradyrhizobium sp. TaxID=376 RepID=UPI001EB1E7B7|nr:hypothetical protein [Bradyrhizobium sp.]MBV8923443.1 hypothetical protein [Bradyrhizobium sp.]MBV9979391.1 hypothetical protein [Bradyrhizobium sp.]